ncbi:hypothetical protein OH779_00800 [Actinacidiphila glaucinigra]|uniref:hypothetical protein n=1 Tax=Actinacidiphila glaucinigra TaxID=235986 RepID=UPI00386AB1B7
MVMKNYPPQFRADAVALYQSRPEATILRCRSGDQSRDLAELGPAAGASRPRGRRAEVPATMILSVVYNGGWRYAEDWDEMLQVIQEVMSGLHSEVEEGRSYSPGDDAWFSFAGERHSDENRVADNHLRLAVNHRTGYGSLVWFVNDVFSAK